MPLPIITNDLVDESTPIYTQPDGVCIFIVLFLLTIIFEFKGMYPLGPQSQLHPLEFCVVIINLFICYNSDTSIQYNTIQITTLCYFILKFNDLHFKETHYF